MSARPNVPGVVKSLPGVSLSITGYALWVPALSSLRVILYFFGHFELLLC